MKRYYVKIYGHYVRVANDEKLWNVPVSNNLNSPADAVILRRQYCEFNKCPLEGEIWSVDWDKMKFEKLKL